MVSALKHTLQGPHLGQVTLNAAFLGGWGLSAGFKEPESTCGPVSELSKSFPPIFSDAENRLAHFAVASRETSHLGNGQGVVELPSCGRSRRGISRLSFSGRISQAPPTSPALTVKADNLAALSSPSLRRKQDRGWWWGSVGSRVRVGVTENLLRSGESRATSLPAESPRHSDTYRCQI